MFRILIFVTAFIFASPLLANVCGPGENLHWTQARVALEGNILNINNRQFVLAGVYAPEMGNPAKRATPRPLSKEAQTYLNRILANNDRKVGIELDEKNIDGFGRLTGHLFLENGRNIGEMLIEQGLALAETFMPNLKYQECYYAAEKRAREKKLGLWNFALQRPEVKFPLALSSQLSDTDNGFRIISGPVRKVMKTKNNYIVNLDTVGIRVQKRNWEQFDFAKLQKLEGKTIEVRGYGFVQGGAVYVVIEHPNMINELNPY